MWADLTLSFWCWVSRRSQRAIVQNARRELRLHAQLPHSRADSEWWDRKVRLRHFLDQQEYILTMIGG